MTLREEVIKPEWEVSPYAPRQQLTSFKQCLLEIHVTIDHLDVGAPDAQAHWLGGTTTCAARHWEAL